MTGASIAPLPVPLIPENAIEAGIAAELTENTPSPKMLCCVALAEDPTSPARPTVLPPYIMLLPVQAFVLALAVWVMRATHKSCGPAFTLMGTDMLRSPVKAVVLLLELLDHE